MGNPEVGIVTTAGQGHVTPACDEGEQLGDQNHGPGSWQSRLTGRGGADHRDQDADQQGGGEAFGAPLLLSPSAMMPSISTAVITSSTANACMLESRALG